MHVCIHLNSRPLSIYLYSAYSPKDFCSYGEDSVKQHRKGLTHGWLRALHPFLCLSHRVGLRLQWDNVSENVLQTREFDTHDS